MLRLLMYNIQSYVCDTVNNASVISAKCALLD